MGKPTEKTLSLLRAFGWYYWRVESFNGFSGKKTDLFNIIDFLVITDYSTIGVQSCGADFASHITKLTVDQVDNTVAWLSGKNRKLLLVGWRKVLLRKGARQRIFKPRIAWVYISKKELIIEEKNTDNYRPRDF